jgi:hypothetical protein
MKPIIGASTRFIAVLAVGFSSSCASSKAHVTFHGGATRDLLAQIQPIVRKQTIEPIVSVDKLPDGTVDVETVNPADPMQGEGHEYTLKRTAASWKIINRSAWVR